MEREPLPPDQSTQPIAPTAGEDASQAPGALPPTVDPVVPPAAESGRSEFAGTRQGREVIWNLPNAITFARIAMVPVMLLIPFPFFMTKFGSQVMAWCFIVAAVSDLVDGWLARRGGGEGITRLGKLLDPLADKLLVSTALIMLLAAGRIPVEAAWMVVVIVGRELAVTGLRGMASTDGHAVGAAWQGKLKAFVQNVAVGALLFHYTTIGIDSHMLGLVLLFAASVLTLWSGWVYFSDYFGNEA